MLKTTMSTAAVSVASVQQGSSAVASGGGDSGFSRVLSGVRAAQSAAQGASPKAQSGSGKAQLGTREAQGERPITDSVRKEEASYSVPPDENNPSGTGTAENAGGEAPVTTLGTEKTPGEAAGELTETGETAPEAEEAIPADPILSLSSKEYGSISVRMEAKLRELILTLSNGDEDEEGKIIDALLKFLKERQEAEDGDTAISLAMQLLTAMLGGQTEQPSLRLSVRDISVEMNAISGVYREETAELSAEDFSMAPTLGEKAGNEVPGSEEPAVFPEAEEVFAETVREQPAPTADGNDAAEAVIREPNETPERTVPIGTTEERPPEAKTTDEAVRPLRAETAEIEPIARETRSEAPGTAARGNEIPEREQPQTIPQTAERLLSEILDRAREELGLTKAELTKTPETREARTLPSLSETETESPNGKEAENGAQKPEARIVNTTARELALSPNHKDGRSELHRILSGGDGTNERRNDFRGAEPNAAAIPQRTEIGEIELPKESEARTAILPPERQLVDELLARSETFEGGRSEFTMVLNPESLGKITVRLISTGGRVQVNIAAENDATRQLLAAREDQIGSALKTNGVELERYQVVSGREEAQLMQDSYDGSSKNPYGQQEERSEERGDDEDDFLEILQQL